MTREEAIKEFESELEWAELNMYPYVSKQKVEADKMAIKAIEQTTWIPVSERLPEEETDVLICNRNGDIALSRGSYSTEVENDFIWYTSGWRFGKVIAWMPLPKPYEPQESEVSG